MPTASRLLPIRPKVKAPLPRQTGGGSFQREAHLHGETRRPWRWRLLLPVRPATHRLVDMATNDRPDEAFGAGGRPSPAFPREAVTVGSAKLSIWKRREILSLPWKSPKAVKAVRHWNRPSGGICREKQGEKPGVRESEEPAQRISRGGHRLQALNGQKKIGKGNWTHCRSGGSTVPKPNQPHLIAYLS